MIRPNAYAERSFTPAADSLVSPTTNTSSSPSSMRSSPTSVEEMSTSRYSEGGVSAVSAPRMMLADRTNSGAPSMLATMNQLYHGSSALRESPTYCNPLTTPHLEIEANRLRTFKEWPIQLKMKPIELSDAGFFYTGMGDRVQCYSCGGGVKDWEDDDVAWEQHALWYPNCDYMKLIKGQRYIEEVQANYRRKQGAENGSSQGEDEVVENSEEELSEGAAEGAPRRQRDAMPSTSRAANTAGAGKVARRRLSRMGSGSHPESDPCSPEAMLAARSAKASEVPETKLCKICYECEFNTAFIPCGHVVACAKCASAVTTCPMCREPFESVTRIYFS